MFVKGRVSLGRAFAAWACGWLKLFVVELSEMRKKGMCGNAFWLVPVQGFVRERVMCDV